MLPDHFVPKSKKSKSLSIFQNFDFFENGTTFVGLFNDFQAISSKWQNRKKRTEFLKRAYCRFAREGQGPLLASLSSLRDCPADGLVLPEASIYLQRSSSLSSFPLPLPSLLSPFPLPSLLSPFPFLLFFILSPCLSSFLFPSVCQVNSLVMSR